MANPQVIRIAHEDLPVETQNAARELLGAKRRRFWAANAAGAATWLSFALVGPFLQYKYPGLFVPGHPILFGQAFGAFMANPVYFGVRRYLFDDVLGSYGAFHQALFKTGYLDEAKQRPVQIVKRTHPSGFLNANGDVLLLPREDPRRRIFEGGFRTSLNRFFFKVRHAPAKYQTGFSIT